MSSTQQDCKVDSNRCPTCFRLSRPCVHVQALSNKCGFKRPFISSENKRIFLEHAIPANKTLIFDQFIQNKVYGFTQALEYGNWKDQKEKYKNLLMVDFYWKLDEFAGMGFPEELVQQTKFERNQQVTIPLQQSNLQSVFHFNFNMFQTPLPPHGAAEHRNGNSSFPNNNRIHPMYSNSYVFEPAAVVQQEETRRNNSVEIINLDDDEECQDAQIDFNDEHYLVSFMKADFESLQDFKFAIKNQCNLSNSVKVAKILIRNPETNHDCILSENNLRIVREKWFNHQKCLIFTLEGVENNLPTL